MNGMDIMFFMILLQACFADVMFVLYLCSCYDDVIFMLRSWSCYNLCDENWNMVKKKVKSGEKYFAWSTSLQGVWMNVLDAMEKTYG